MEHLLIALICMMVGATAHHLGLTEEVARIASKIAKCPKCCSFWLTFAVLVYLGCNPFITVALSMFVAYLSYYFGLILILLQKLYNWLWQKINQNR